MTQQTPQIEQDRELARQVAGGDAAAFDAFFKEYFPRLFRFALGRVALGRVDNDPSLAEEAVQRTMCIVVRKMGTYRGEALLFSWLCQICRNELSALFRQRGDHLREQIPIDDHPAVQAALEAMVNDDYRPEMAQRQEEIAEFVRVTLQHLPLRYARALEMKYVGGHSVVEIARELEVSEKAAESVLTRARKAFRDGFSALWDFEPGIEL
ncbi:MAG: sigma-70 family RNA polymerase sigma factor [Woeseiaceae bacterium]